MDIKHLDIVLCKFYFSDSKAYKNRPVLVFKDNLPYDDFVGLPIKYQGQRFAFNFKSFCGAYRL